MPITVHAFAAYAADPEPARFDSTIEWEYFAETEYLTGAEDRAAALYDGYDNGTPDDTAITQYRVEFASYEQIDKFARAGSSFSADAGVTFGLLSMAMDTIEWDLNWAHPAVTVVRENDLARRLREDAAVKAAAARAENPVLAFFDGLGSEATPDVADYFADMLERYSRSAEWDTYDFGGDLADVLENSNIAQEPGGALSFARQHLLIAAAAPDAAVPA